MIDRRRFVQSMIALGAASSVRPATALFAAQSVERTARSRRRRARVSEESSARATPTSASTATTSSSSSPATAASRTSSTPRTTASACASSSTGRGGSPAAASSRKTRSRASRRRRRASPRRTGRSTRSRCGSRRSQPYNTVWNTPVKKNPFEMPLQPKLDLLLQIHEEALKVPGASFVSAFMQFVNEHKYFASTDGSHIEQSLIRSYPSFSVTAVDKASGKFYRAEVADLPDGDGLRVHRRLSPARGSARRRRGSRGDAQGQAGAGRTEERSSCTRRICG